MSRRGKHQHVALTHNLTHTHAYTNLKVSVHHGDVLVKLLQVNKASIFRQ